MKKITLLFLLIKTMSKSEKRHFKLYTKLQKGNKRYMYLYELLLHCDTIEDVYKAFHIKYGEKSLTATCQYLYDLLIKILVYLNKNNDIQNSIFELIMQANFLYQRHFIDEAFEPLYKAKQLAKKNEQDILLMLIRRIEISYIQETGFRGLTEKALVKKQTKLIETQKYTRSTNMHISLYSTLKYRLKSLDKIRSKKQKELMNDLVLSELNLISNNYYQGFESMKLHLLFQATYYLNTGSYKSAIRYYNELLNIFDENEHIKKNPPIYYLTTLEGIINSVLTAGLYNEIPVFINKLQKLHKKDLQKDFLLRVEWLIIFSKTLYLLQKNSYVEAKNLFFYDNQIFFKKTNTLPIEDKLNLHLCSTIICLYNNEIKQANTHMRKIIRESKLYQLFPTYRIVRLLKLLIDVELNNIELLDNDIRSIKRSFRKDSQAYLTEKVICKFVQMYPIPNYEKTRNKLWKKLEKDILNIRNNKFEHQLLYMFDFTNWMESRLTGKELSEIKHNGSSLNT